MRASDRLLPIPLSGRNRIWLTILQSIWIKPHRKVGFSFVKYSEGELTFSQSDGCYYSPRQNKTHILDVGFIFLITVSKVPRKAGVLFSNEVKN